MNLLLPVITAILFVATNAFQKMVLAKTRVPIERFLPMTGLGIVGCGVITLALFPNLLPETLSPLTLGLLGLLGLLGVGSNLLYYRGFRDEPLSRIQFAVLIKPVFIFTLAALLFPTERHPIAWLLGGIAVAALLYGHTRHRRITFDRHERSLLGFALVSAIEAVTARFLLDDLSPVFLYTTQVASSGILLFAYFGFPWQAFRWNKASRSMLEIGAMAFIATCATYLSYQLVGITITSLVILLVKPVLYYWVSQTLFGETLPKALLVGSAGIVVVLAYMSFLLR